MIQDSVSFSPGMAVLDDIAAITAEHAGDKLRYFAGVDPETREVTIHPLRDDIQWTNHREREVTEELHEVTAKESYEHTIGVDNVNQVIKVADSKVIFTGFIDEQVAIAPFERGVFALLPPIVADFREYMIEPTSSSSRWNCRSGGAFHRSDRVGSHER